jgi:hypothetical protein
MMIDVVGTNPDFEPIKYKSYKQEQKDGIKKFNTFRLFAI